MIDVKGYFTIYYPVIENGVFSRQTASGACNRLPMSVSAIQARTRPTAWGERRAARSGEPACDVDDRASHLLQFLRPLKFLQK